MKQCLSILFYLIMWVCQPSFASDTNHTGIAETQAIRLGGEVAKRLAFQDAGLGFGQLPQSWLSIPTKDITLHKKGNGYYIIAVENKSNQKTLYVLMSWEGEVYDANLTGDFGDID